MMPKVWSSIEEKFQGNKGQKTSILTHIGRFQTVTPIRIHHWLWNDAPSLSSIEEVPYSFSRSSIKFQGHTGQKNRRFFTWIERFRTVTPVWIYQWIWNDAQSLM